MLQQIIQEMYIEPDILAELSDEQKHILFMKIREEQVRRYNINEQNASLDDKKHHKRQNDKKKVTFKSGSDGKEWVWVMGEHKNDKTIEQLLEEEARQKALREAEEELEVLRRKEEEELARKLQEEERLIEEAKQAEIRRKEAEAIEKTVKAAARQAQLEQERLELEKQEQERIDAFRKSFVRERQKSIEKLEKEKKRRSTEILSEWRERRKTIEKLAEKDSKEVEDSWKEQEKKAKEAQEQLRLVVQHAREEFRNSFSGPRTAITAVSAFTDGLKKPPVPQKNVKKLRRKQRTPRPLDRQAVTQWFLEEEKPQEVGLDPDTKQVQYWFHGVISRMDAEKLLINRRVGTFLVRVSERVWGYTISYRASDRCKHFLIDTSDAGYQFLGANQLVHASLHDLVNFHKNNTITVTGGETLQFPCGQEKEPPDYVDFYPPNRIRSTQL